MGAQCLGGRVLDLNQRVAILRLAGSTVGVQCLGGRVLDLESKGGKFETHRRHCGSAVSRW